MPAYLWIVLCWSRPARARGLKPVLYLLPFNFILSRPARARGLKLDLPTPYLPNPWVAPRAGAWIETTTSAKRRGWNTTVAPRAGAWIETGTTWTCICVPFVSRPARARGLKHNEAPRRPCNARGLKHRQHVVFGWIVDVAPRAGAWIETCDSNHSRRVQPRRAPRGRVD